MTPTEKGILFSGAMVRAILDGRKTQTRRIVKVPNGCEVDGYAADEPGGVVLCSGPSQPTGSVRVRAPYGPVGRRLWVRETHQLIWTEDGPGDMATGDGFEVAYMATEASRELCEPDSDDTHRRARSPLHMPRWASRLTLAVTRIRVERVQDISEDDARAEGVDWASPYLTRKELRCADDDREDPREVGYSSGSFARTNYAKLWDEIIGAGSWAENPWVWVYDFEVVREAGFDG